MAEDGTQPRLLKDDDDDDSDVDIAFAAVDYSGVNVYGVEEVTNDPKEELALAWERRLVFGDCPSIESGEESLSDLKILGDHLASGKYADALRSTTATAFFHKILVSAVDGATPPTISRIMRERVFSKGSSVVSLLQVEALGIAALNLFLQSNYTGPSLDSALGDINPHPCFTELLGSSKDSDVKEEEQKESATTTKRNTKYQNAVLAEMAVDGEWPVQVCNEAYFLLIARIILSTLANHSGSMNVFDRSGSAPSEEFVRNVTKLSGVHLWHARAVVAHERMLEARTPSETLWNEARTAFERCVEVFCSGDKPGPNFSAATVMLEYGLAEHHFDQPGKGRLSFLKAQEFSGLEVEVTGADGKRTKFQQTATAQMLVRAKSAVNPSQKSRRDNGSSDTPDQVKSQMIEHTDEGILLERIRFDDEKNNEILDLCTLDQAILLALCLDVKNSNPADGLTNEEMGAFLSRVLDHHNDWMIYATALLERAWLEFERSHARERSILQMQALVDQHTNRLTITQSTRQSIEEAAPVQDRLKNLHSIVYPPRWVMIQDLADRYAELGVVTSAAELYTEVEFWDDVVACYRRAGRVNKAEEIVREQLAVKETPRMWTALGDITNDPRHYEKAIELSKGRFSAAFISLAGYYFGKGELEQAAENYTQALKIRPLGPSVWFRLGTICMQLGRWDSALKAFSQTVQQDPEAADAWANVAAVHMHNKQPSEAYPALAESLKHNRSNWRVWLSQLYTCLDLHKFDEAIQASNTYLDLRAERKASDGIPCLEEKCVKAIVGGVIQNFQESQDNVARESTRRSLVRVHDLLDRISSSSDAEPWVFETMAYFHEKIGHDDMVLDNLMKEYRALQSIPSWEKDDAQVRKLCKLVSHIAFIHRRASSRESLVKAKFLVRGVVKKIQTARPDAMPEEVQTLEGILEELDKSLQNFDG